MKLAIIILGISLVSAGIYFIITPTEITSYTILDTTKTVINQDITYPKGTPHITSKIVTIPAGQQTGYHTHNNPMYGYILQGEITVDYKDKGVIKYTAGDSLIEAIKYTHNGINTGIIPAKVLVVVMGNKTQ